MSAPSSAVDFFALEASDYLDRLDALLASAGSAPPDADSYGRLTRALRGAATMARQAPLAELASALEGTAPLARDGARAWTPAVSDAALAAVDAYRALLRNVRSWTPADDASATARTAELRRIASAPAAGATTAPRSGTIVPIARFFFDDDGPHVVERDPRPPITADLRFRQAAVPLASTLRRLIVEARQAVDDGARRALGDDLRAAIRDLGDLAESYDIAPVTNFARAREAALGRLDDRALDVVDGAAEALVESAGVAWARPTPPSPASAVAPPPNEAPSAVEAPPPNETRAPASGQALVALLESGISGLHQFGADEVTDVPAAPETAPSEPVAPNVAPSDEPVSIDTLLYRGRAALDRAREVRDVLRASAAPDPAMLAELYDLLDLASVDEPARA